MSRPAPHKPKAGEFKPLNRSPEIRAKLGAVSDLTEEQKDEMWAIFLLFDKDKSGSVDESELADVFAACGLDITTQEISEMMRMADLDGCGNLDFEEFCALLAAQQDDDNLMMSLRSAFDALDLNGDGQLSEGDLKKTLGRYLKEKITDEEIVAMVTSTAIDEDHDGLISFDEFVQVMVDAVATKRRWGLSGEGGQEKNRFGLTPQQVSELRQIFSIFDKDHSGTISIKELMEVSDSMGFELESKEAKSMLNAVDRDRSGTVGFEEFMELMAPFFEDTMTHDILEAIFKNWDRDEDGVLSFEDLYDAASRIRNVNEEEIRAMLALGDIDQQESLCYHEFIEALVSGATVLAKRQGKAPHDDPRRNSVPSRNGPAPLYGQITHSPA